MKQGKKFFALVLGLALVMSCLSAYAEAGLLRVKGEPAGVTLYESNFETAPDSDRFELKNMSYDETEKGLKFDKSTSLASMFFNKDHSGISGTLVIEYKLRLASVKEGNQIQMHLLNSNRGELTDMRIYNGSYMGIITRDSAQAESKTFEINSNELTCKVMYNNITREKAVWVNGVQQLSETGGYLWDRWFENANDLAGLRIATNTDCEVYLESLKFSTIPTEASPAAGEVLFSEDFEDGEVDRTKFTTLNDQLCTIENGALISTATGGDVAWVLKFGEKFTGIYVAEIVVSGTTANTYQRFNFATGDKFYACYDALNLGYRRFAVDGKEHINVNDFRSEDYKATTSAKISVYYNTNTRKQILYCNDIKVWEDTYDTMDNILVDGMYLNQYGGEVRVESIRVYRPFEGFSVNKGTNAVTIQTSENQEVQMAAATFSGEAAAPKLESVGARTLTLEPNQIYTVYLEDYVGGRFFLWNSLLKPIRAAINID